MKSYLHRSLMIFMAFLVLLSSTGFALVEHECMMRGKSVRFLQEIKEAGLPTKKAGTCCAKSKLQKESKQTILKKADCCKENHKFEKLETNSSGSQLLVKFAKAVTDIFPWPADFYALLISAYFPSVSGSFSDDISFSSMFHGRGMLVFIQSFLI